MPKFIITITRRPTWIETQTLTIDADTQKEAIEAGIEWAITEWENSDDAKASKGYEFGAESFVTELPDDWASSLDIE